MKILQNLWTKRCSVGDPPLICRSPQQSQDLLEIPDLHKNEVSSKVTVTVKMKKFPRNGSLHLYDFINCSKPWKLGRRSGRGSFSALRRALTGTDKLGFKEFPSIEGITSIVVKVDLAIPSDNWKKTFSLCDQDGDQLLVLETSSENTTLIAGSITGISFELFRSQGMTTT